MSPNSVSSSFLSLGLDIGTTTTHLVISRLSMAENAHHLGPAQIEGREVVYRGRIHRTPLVDASTVDADAVSALVHEEFARAGVSPADLLTGAVIITGETALKRNAEQVVRRLAGEASSFAAAVAGANQEAILAGRGSGAAEWSRRHRCCVLNIDIGGGTSNFAWFEGGKPVQASALRIGGRHLLKAEAGWMPATHTAAAILGREAISKPAAERWLASCARALAHLAVGRTDSLNQHTVITLPAEPPPVPQVLFLSGGVAELAARLERGQPVAVDLDDCGELLARAVLAEPQLGRFERQYPLEPIRATVIGAGEFSTEFSGQTCWVDAGLLPLRNLPVIRPWAWLSDLGDASQAAAAITARRAMADLPADEPCAIALPSLRQADWDAVVALAGVLAQAAAEALPQPWVFTMSDNFGRLLGRSMQAAAPQAQLLVIDELKPGPADLLDVGSPLGSMVPVVLKSLVFEREASR